MASESHIFHLFMNFQCFFSLCIYIFPRKKQGNQRVAVEGKAVPGGIKTFLTSFPEDVDIQQFFSCFSITEPALTSMTMMTIQCPVIMETINMVLDVPVKWQPSLTMITAELESRIMLVLEVCMIIQKN